MGLAIPITLFITFGMTHTLGIDLQQVSIATLIIALGLLVDVPVVSGDAIKNQLGAGLPPLTAAWVGPTKLIVAIILPPLTAIVFYLPFLTLPGSLGEFLYSLPIVLTFFTGGVDRGDVNLHPDAFSKPRTPAVRGGASQQSSSLLLQGRRVVDQSPLDGPARLACPTGWLADSWPPGSSRFPEGLTCLSYLDVWLPEDAPLYPLTSPRGAPGTWCAR